MCVFMKGVELHVLYVPEDQFDRRLNKVSADAVSAFISAGFIRFLTDFTQFKHMGASCLNFTHI